MTLSTGTPDQERLVYEAICAVAAHCDGAIQQDGVGFNGQDTKFGRRISALSFDEWTPDIRFEAARISITYQQQIETYTGIKVRELDVVNATLESGTNHVARDQARQSEKKRTAASRRHVSLEGDRIVFSFPYDGDIKDALKAAGCRFDGNTKTWWTTAAQVNKDIVNVALSNGFQITDEADAVLEAAATIEKEDVPTGTVELKRDGTLFVTLVGHLGGALFGEYRGLDDYRWVRGSQSSSVAASVRNITWLADHGFAGTEGIQDALAEQLATAAVKAEASKSAQSTLDLSDVTPDGLTPYPFQVAGVEYALAAKRCFIADEMGLGKTVQAILAAEKAQAKQVIVICPASLKGNWAKEIARWAPKRTVNVLSGRKADLSQVHAGYIIVNYDILSAWAEVLDTIGAEALIVDESHYAKEAKAQRTKALLKLADSVPASGLVLLLTGTPILNRPNELVTQLRILGRLGDIISSNRGNDDRALEGAFKYRYCGPEQNRWGWTFNGASNLEELNSKLRATCLVRREREDVLDLKATTHTRVQLSLNGALNDYRRAEEDVISYIKTELGDAAARKAKRAEVLVKLNLLRRLSEEAKVVATVEWVQDWLDSFPTKKLVIFSGHISVQHALVEAFDAPHILGSQKDAEEQKAAFQEGDARVIVCSLQAAREGHTLTAASDVVFTSLGWTPGGLQQAEDRCNRIGQEADQVVAWQLHAEDTIDETIADLIASKAAVFDAAIKGIELDEDDDVVEGVISYLEGK